MKHTIEQAVLWHGGALVRRASGALFDTGNAGRGQLDGQQRRRLRAGNGFAGQRQSVQW
mgnify:CR=1 FL=1